MSGDSKKDLEAGPDSSRNLWSEVRSGLGHVGLLLALMIYTAVGGMVSRLFVHFTCKQFFFKFNMYYALYNTRGMNIWVVRPFFRPQLRNQGTESVKWRNTLRVVLRVRFSVHGSNIWKNLVPDYQFYRKLLVLPQTVDLVMIYNIYSKQLSILYALVWVIPRRLNFICRRSGTPCLLFHHHRQVDTYLPMMMEQSVPKRRHIKFRRRGITQKKEYNIQNTAKV